MIKAKAAFFLVVLCASATGKLAAAEDAPIEAAPAKKLMEFADVMKMPFVGAPVISPDGKWIAYSRTDLSPTGGGSAVMLLSTDGETSLPFIGSDYGAESLQWSPDGRYLAFLSTKGSDDAKQVWTIDTRGGSPRQYTGLPQGVTSFSWAPDNRRMALIASDFKEKPATPQPYVIDRILFKKDYVGYLDRTRTHVYVVEDRMAEAAQITFGDYDDTDATWSPDGRFVAFTSNRTEEPDLNVNTDIWIVSPDATAERQEPRQVTTDPSQDRTPVWSNDSRHIAYISTHDYLGTSYGIEEVMIVSVDGGSPRSLTAPLDQNAPHRSKPVFSSNDRHIYFRLEVSSRFDLARVRVSDGKVDRLLAPDESMSSFTMSSNNVIVTATSSAQRPTEFYLLDRGKRSKLTEFSNDFLDTVELADVRSMWFKSTDGVMVEQLVYLPPGSEEGERLPTYVQLHGGPVLQNTIGFDLFAQLNAAQGYAVLLPNFRGSSGYGKEFSLGAFAAWGKQDYEDVMAGVDAAIEEGIADPDRLAVGGWSYGGILGAHVITKTDRFKAAFIGAGEAMYVANYGPDMWPILWEAEFGLPWENRELWEDLSPYWDLPKVTTPTLFVGGENDLNVPIASAERMYAVLRRIGVPTRLVIYPGEYHVVSNPAFQMDLRSRVSAWFAKYVLGEGEESPEGPKQ